MSAAMNMLDRLVREKRLSLVERENLGEYIVSLETLISSQRELIVVMEMQSKTNELLKELREIK